MNIYRNIYPIISDLNILLIMCTFRVFGFTSSIFLSAALDTVEVPAANCALVFYKNSSAVDFQNNSASWVFGFSVSKVFRCALTVIDI